MRTADTAALTVSRGLRTTRTQWSGPPPFTGVVKGSAALAYLVSPIVPKL